MNKQASGKRETYDSSHLDNQMQPIKDSSFSFQKVDTSKSLSDELLQAVQNNIVAFNIKNASKNSDVEGITALYVRLSQEDRLDGESNSISNQKKILDRYCREHNYRITTTMWMMVTAAQHSNVLPFKKC